MERDARSVERARIKKKKKNTRILYINKKLIFLLETIPSSILSISRKKEKRKKKEAPLNNHWII